MAVLFPDIVPRFFDSDGVLLSGGTVTFYETGTTTLKDVYTDSSGGTPASNPVTLDSNGQCEVYASGTYKVVIKDSAGAEVNTIDPWVATAAGGTITSTDNAIARFDGTVGDLQNSGWLIDDSDNATASGNLAMVDNTISGAVIQDQAEAGSTASATTGNVTFNYANGPNYATTLTGNVTVTDITNPPASGNYGSVTLEWTQSTAGSHTVSYASKFKWDGGSAPTLTVTASAVDVVTGYTRDGGTTWRMFNAGQNLS